MKTLLQYLCLCLPYLWAGAVYAQPNITRVEYYIDTDPGYGLATAVATTPATDLVNISLSINPAPLAEGVHILVLRARDANGAWSHNNKWLFLKPYSNQIPGDGPLPKLVAAEYYIDTDPGYGKAIPIAIDTTVSSLADVQLSMNVTSLATGAHSLMIRGKDANGAWSHNNTWNFNIGTALAAPAINVSAISKLILCARDSFTISYHATGTYTAGNIFTVELSDAAGGFANPITLGSLTSQTNGIIVCHLPAHAANGSGYKIRVRSSNAVVTGAASTATLTIHDRPSAQTISGRNFVNGGYTWPYSVPTTTGSSWNWQVTGGSRTSGTNTNTGDIQWQQPVADMLSGNIKMIETNQYGCVGDTSLQAVIIYKLSIADTVLLAYCKMDTAIVKIGASGAFDAGNQHIAELSNANGSFAAPLSTATLLGNGNGLHQPFTIRLPIPGGIANGTGYRIRVRSTIPAFIGDTSANISIQKPDAGTDLAKTKCGDNLYNLTQHFTDASLNYTYFSQAFVPIPQPGGVANGSYNVVATNTQGCKDTAVVTINSNPAPNLGADTTVYHTCPDQTTNLQPLYTTTGLTAIWSTGNTSAAPPGNYRLVVTNSFNCTDTAYAFIVLETAIWTGSVSSNWHTAANWSTGKVPSSLTHVIVGTAIPNICTISAANAKVASVQVRNGATIRTTDDKLLEIVGKCGKLP